MLKVLEKADWDESEHPRDEAGRFGFGGGGADSEEGGGGGKGEHPGKGYSKGAYVDSKGVIQTTSVYDAQRALHENRKVELDQPRKVSVLIQKLGEVAKKMIEKGEAAPKFNLCNVSVKGTSLFCADTKGIPRVEMPQMDKQQTKDFRKYLKDKGYKVEKDKVTASHLRATQNEIDGAKVAATAKKLEKEGGEISKRLIISKDDYVLDGHHHWAAKIGLDAADNKLHDDTKVRVSRVNISITKLLAEAEKFTGGKGHKDTGKSFSIGEVFREWDESEHPRDEAGRFGFGGGGSDGEEVGGRSGGSSDRKMGTATPEQFVAARDESARSAYLSNTPAEELAGNALYLSRDNKSGYALDPKTDLQNLFNNGPPGGGHIALVHAIKNGASTLDAFDGHLPRYYTDHGFIPTGRLKFNDEFAPAGWDYDKDGRPDIVFMAYAGGDRKTIDERVGRFEPYVPGTGPYFADYDSAKAASRSAIVDKGFESSVQEFDGARPEHRGRGGLHQALGVSPGDPAEAGERLRPVEPRRIYVRSHLVKAHHAIALMEAEGFDIIPYDGEYIPGTELIDTREWDESLHPRDDAGRFGFGGGGSDGGGEAENASARVPTKEQYDSVTKSPEFKRWFGNSEEVTKPDGSPMVLYHGGTHEYREFASKMANPEGNWGAGFYFSNSPKDVNVNYAGVGADLDVKIERETERILGLNENADMSTEEGRKEALKNIVGSGGLIFPVYVRMEKPFITGGDNETRLDFDAGYNPDTDEYDKQESGAVVDFIRGIREAAQDFGDNQANLDSLVGKITDAAIDGDIKASKLEALFREDDHIGYLEGDDGKLVSNEVFRRGLEEAGFDGVIDVNVAKKFHMEGMDEDTTHYIVFEPTQIKSAIGNSGDFDPKDPDITKDWDEGKHPREPAGSSTGGQFGSGGGGESEAETPSAANDYGLSTKEKADLKVFGGGIKVDWKNKAEYDALRSSKDFGETLDKLPKQTGTFYRGMVIPKKEAEQFVSVGGTITIAKHSFASPQRDYAKSFAQLQILRGAKGSIPIVMSIKNANAVAFGKAGYGASKNRLEVVLPIGDKMRITSVRETVINDVKGYNVVAEYV